MSKDTSEFIDIVDDKVWTFEVATEETGRVGIMDLYYCTYPFRISLDLFWGN